MDVTEIGSGSVKWINLVQHRDYCEHRYKLFGSIKCGEVLGCVTTHLLLD